MSLMSSPCAEGAADPAGFEGALWTCFRAGTEGGGGWAAVGPEKMQGVHPLPSRIQYR